MGERAGAFADAAGSGGGGREGAGAAGAFGLRCFRDKGADLGAAVEAALREAWEGVGTAEEEADGARVGFGSILVVREVRCD